MNIARNSIGVSTLASFCLFTVIAAHAVSENAAASIYDELKKSPDNKIQNFIKSYQWSKDGRFSSDPLKIFFPDFQQQYLGIYPSIAIVFFSNLFLISRLRDNLRNTLESGDWKQFLKIEKTIDKIGLTAILCAISIWVGYFVFILNDPHLFTSWVDYLLILAFSFLMGEVIGLTYFFSYRIQILRKFRKTSTMEGKNPEENKKFVINLESKTWIQMLQIHIALYLAGMVGFVITSYTQFFIKLPEDITMLPTYNTQLLSMVFLLCIIVFCMFIVMLLIIRYLYQLSDIAVDDAGV